MWKADNTQAHLVLRGIFRSSNPVPCSRNQIYHITFYGDAYPNQCRLGRCPSAVLEKTSASGRWCRVAVGQLLWAPSRPTEMGRGSSTLKKCSLKDLKQMPFAAFKCHAQRCKPKEVTLLVSPIIISSACQKMISIIHIGEAKWALNKFKL